MGEAVDTIPSILNNISENMLKAVLGGCNRRLPKI